MKQIFISYAREDLLKAQSIFTNLKKEGLNPWMDKPPKPYELDGLLPGEFWKDRLSKEIKESQFLIALLSNNSITKRGYVQREFKLALDIMNELPYGEEFLIPLLLDKCKVPNLKVGFVSLNELNWHDLETGGLTPIILKVKRNLNKFQEQLLLDAKFERKPIVGLKTRTIDFEIPDVKESIDQKINWRNFIGKQKWKNNPQIFNSQIIVGSAGKTWNSGDEFDGIYSMDEHRGDILWKVDTLADANEVTIHGNTVYSGTDGGEIFSIDAESGTVNWCRIYDGEFHVEIKIVNQKNKPYSDIIAFDFFGNILLIDSITSDVLDSIKIKDNFRSSAIKLNNDFLIIVTQKGGVIYIEVTDDSLKITKRLDLRSEVYSTPILYNTNLIVGLCYASGNVPLISVDLKTGKKNWHAFSKSKMGNIRANLIDHNNHVWIGGTYSNKLFGIDKLTGKSNYEIETGEESFPAWSAPAFKGEFAFLPRNDGFLHVIDTNLKQAVDKIDLKVDAEIPKIEYGKETINQIVKYVRHKWENYFYSTPIIKENKLYIGTDEGYFYSIDIKKTKHNN